MLAHPAHAGESGYCRQPALNGSRLVFVAEGDLFWCTLPEQGFTGEGPHALTASRLTSADGHESHPRFSPDGQWLAFAAAYEGNTDVYVMPAEGGTPRRLTHHPADDLPIGWTADGQSILFTSDREYVTVGSRAFRVHVTGGAATALNFGPCGAVSFSSTGQRFAFNPWTALEWQWEGYRGGLAGEIWLGNTGDGTYTRFTNHPARDLWPQWIGGRVYFATDRGGAMNIASDALAGSDVRMHTSFAPVAGQPTAIEGYALRDLSCDSARRGTKLVFSQGGRLAIYDTEHNRLERLEISLVTDRVATRRRAVPLLDRAERAFFAPMGDAIIVEARGELVRVDLATELATTISRSPGVRERGAVPLQPNHLAFITDESGSQQIGLMAADGSEPGAPLTENVSGWLFDPVASPTGTHVAWGDSLGRLTILDVMSLERTAVETCAAGHIEDYRFSPDGNWLAWTRPLPTGLSQVMLFSLRTRAIVAVTDGRHADHSPRWDPARLFLYFLSDRWTDPLIDPVTFTAAPPTPTLLGVVPLQRLLPPPTPHMNAGQFDLELWGTPGMMAPEPGVVEMEGGRPEAEDFRRPQGPMMVDEADIPARVALLPLRAGRYGDLEAIWGGVTMLSDAPRGGMEDEAHEDEPTSALLRFDPRSGQVTVLAPATRSYSLSLDASILVHTTNEGVRIVPMTEMLGPPHEISLKEATILSDPAAERAQIFREAWQRQLAFFWAPNMAGIDWKAMIVKYEALLPRLGSREELNDVLAQLFGELRTSHAFVGGGDRHRREEPSPVSTGLLGADLLYRNGSVRLERILPPAEWIPQMDSPLARPWNGVKPGDRLVAIDGNPIGADTDPYALLVDRAGAPITLTVESDGGGNRRTVEMIALDDESELRQLAWARERHDQVATLGKGRLGYVHVPDMMPHGLASFLRQWMSTFDRQAIIIDLRGNEGGFLSGEILRRLAMTPAAWQTPRHGETLRYPPTAPSAHLAVLIDAGTSSDGEILAHAFQQQGLGPVIGTRSWGGVVGYADRGEFADGGRSALPELALRSAEAWVVENAGVVPDIEVECTPTDHQAGRDPALERAVEILLKKLEDSPRQMPPVPAYPVPRQP